MTLIIFFMCFSSLMLGFFLGAGLVHSGYKRRAAMVRRNLGIEG